MKNLSEELLFKEDPLVHPMDGGIIFLLTMCELSPIKR